MGDKLQHGNHNYVVINTTTQEEANKLFAVLSEGGTIETPIGEQYFGYYGSFTDKFGIGWMLLCWYLKKLKEILLYCNARGFFFFIKNV